MGNIKADNDNIDNIKIGNVIGNRYIIKALLGSGANGQVYLVEDMRLGKEWAAKKIDRIENELMALKTIDHPAFPKIIDICIVDDEFYLVMDYIEGKSLDDILKDGIVSESTVLDWAEQLADGLNYLHSGNPVMLYMDCKPSNIIVGRDGKLKLVDLGSIYLKGIKAGGRISGTYGYASPEQIKGEIVDERSDIYAYGRTLKRMLMGGGSKSMKYKRSLKTMNKIIKKSTAKNPSRRYQSMGEILHTLQSRDTLYEKVMYILGGLISYSYKMLIGLFVVIGYYTFKFSRELEYFILATVLFIYLLIICGENQSFKEDGEYICYEDIHLGSGKQLITYAIFGILLGTILLSAVASFKRVTLYDEEGYKVLYKDQKICHNEKGELVVVIPLVE